MKNQLLMLSATVFLSLATATQATVVYSGSYTGTTAEVNSATEPAYSGDVSAADLINGSTPTITGWTLSNGAHPNELTDGIHGGSFADEGNTVSGAWTSVGATAEYNLGTGANGLGYDITSIVSIAAWVNVAFGNQGWQLEVRPLGGSFETALTVDYQPLGGIGATKVTLTDLNISGVDAIKITANSINGGANGGNFVWRELDVFGTDTAAAIPAPAALPAGLALIGLVASRRRRR